jgi:hypothetical protein
VRLLTPSIQKPRGYRQLLSVGTDAKTIKGNKYGYLTGIMYLAPANESGVMNVCTSSTAECRKFCLYNSGRAMAFPEIKRARIAKTRLLHRDRKLFLECLRYDIHALYRTAAVKEMTPTVRINGTSDLPWLAKLMAEEFPEIQFYDYTKHARPWQRLRTNYSITMSYSGGNSIECLEYLKRGGNVAVVFNQGKGKPLPVKWLQYPVVDGDLSDLRFLDPIGTVIGLRVKQTGQGEVKTGGFFVSVASLTRRVAA